jgi:holo-[acyl-carrier protein] synthase
MIIGIGMDLVEIDRIEDSIRRFGDRFLGRILRAEEIRYCQGQGRPALHVAARFAAKEAASKAFGTGIGSDLAWLDLEVLREPSGKPVLVLHDAGRALAEERGIRAVHLTLTHTGTTAGATVILEG